MPHKIRDSEEAQHIERLPIEAAAPRDIKIAVSTWITTAAICCRTISDVAVLIGSGFMGQAMCNFFNRPDLASWPSAIISICIVSLSVPLAQLVDSWGRKWTLITSGIVGLVGALIMSRSQSIESAIAGFALSGLYFGASFASYAVVSEILPRQLRATAQASAQMATGIGAVASILAAGALLRHGHQENFRTYYYIVTAIHGVCIILLLICYRPAASNLKCTWKTKVQSIDWIGNFLVTSSACLFNVSLASIDDLHPFVGTQNLTLFIMGSLLLMAFLFYEWLIKQDGLLHHALFRSRNFPIVLFTIFTEGLMFFTLNTYFISEQIVLQSQDPWPASIRYMLVFLFILISATLTGAYTTYTKRLLDPLVFGFVALLVFAALMSTVNEFTTASKLYGTAALAGFGDGALFVNLAVAAQLATPRNMIATTTGLLIAARGLGGVIIIPVNGVIFEHTLRRHLIHDIAASVKPFGLKTPQIHSLATALAAGNQTAIQVISGANGEIVAAATHGYRSACAKSYRMVWLATLAFSAVALIAVCFLERKKEEFDAHIDGPTTGQLTHCQKTSDPAWMRLHESREQWYA